MKSPRARFAPYLRTLADRMGLRDWTIVLGEDPPDDPRHMADVDCVYGLKRAEVSVSSVFLSKPPEEQRQTLVHELVHAHMAPMHHYLHRTLPDLQWEGYKLTMEYAVDGIAEALAPSLPLPPAPGKR